VHTIEVLLLRGDGGGTRGWGTHNERSTSAASTAA
jgi:hypothetical protein